VSAKALDNVEGFFLPRLIARKVLESRSKSPIFLLPRVNPDKTIVSTVMKRIFLFNETLIPIMDYDFRVTIIALQAVRGLIIEKKGWPENLELTDKVLSRFLDVPIIPNFLQVGDDFVAYETKYQNKIKELTGHNSSTKNFVPEPGRTFRSFAENRLGTTLDGALFLALLDLHRTGRAHIPSFLSGSAVDIFDRTITSADHEGLIKAMDVILNPLLEPHMAVVQMNPPMDKEFANIGVVKEASAIGKTFGDLMTEALSPAPIPLSV
jgi:hypothetical protein